MILISSRVRSQEVPLYQSPWQVPPYEVVNIHPGTPLYCLIPLPLSLSGNGVGVLTTYASEPVHAQL